MAWRRKLLCPLSHQDRCNYVYRLL